MFNINAEGATLQKKIFGHGATSPIYFLFNSFVISFSVQFFLLALIDPVLDGVMKVR